MLMYQFRKPSAHFARICTVQFVRAFQSASSRLDWNHWFVVMALDCNNHEGSR